MPAFTAYLNPVKVYVFITLVLALLYTRKKSRVEKSVCWLLVIAFAAELSSLVLLTFGEKMAVAVSTNIYLVANTLLWFLIAFQVFQNRSIVTFAFLAFVPIASVSLWFDGIYIFNSYAFIGGALLYVMIFLLDGLEQLQKENLNYFSSASFILISAPVIFFIGLSVLFAFRSRTLDDTIIGGLKLFTWVNYFVNFVYYTMINVYVLRHKRV